MKKDIRKFIYQQRKFYKSIVSVSCPILQDTVYSKIGEYHEIHLMDEANYMRPKGAIQSGTDTTA